MREYYRHYAGLQDSFEIKPIYARHADLFTRDAVQALRELDAGASGDGDEHRRARMLLDFAVEGYVGEATKAVEEELARTEAALTIEVGDEELGFREAPVVQANEADAGRRAEIERALLVATDEQLGALPPRADRAPARLRGRARVGELRRHVRALQGHRPAGPVRADRGVRGRQRVELSADARAGAAPHARDRHGRAAPRRPAPLLPGLRAGRPLSGRTTDRELRRNDARPRDRRVAAGRRDVRHRDPSEQVAAGVLRAGARARRGVSGRGSGRRPGRLRDAVPRGRPHRAHRERRPRAAVRVPLPGRQLDQRDVRVPVAASGRGSGVALAPARRG